MNMLKLLSGKAKQKRPSKLMLTIEEININILDMQMQLAELLGDKKQPAPAPGNTSDTEQFEDFEPFSGEEKAE